MPNKAVAGYTQIPVAAQDILMVRHDRIASDGSTTRVLVEYQVRDSVGGVRFTRTVAFQSGAYPVTGASILSACNTQEGT